MFEGIFYYVIDDASFLYAHTYSLLILVYTASYFPMMKYAYKMNLISDAVDRWLISGMVLTLSVIPPFLVWVAIILPEMILVYIGFVVGAYLLNKFNIWYFES